MTGFKFFKWQTVMYKHVIFGFLNY